MKYNYGKLVSGELHYHIIVWDSTGKRRVFGTNAHMLIDKDDAERFKFCELNRYPLGKMTGEDNKVIVIEVLYDGKSIYENNIVTAGCDEVSRIFDSKIIGFAKNSYSIKIVREL